jgi:2-polyprenyl-6-methoxyphenol hydroxylase-like FAD-dependent oxidoreductase
MLLRSDWDVVVLERTGGRLAGRGAGLGVHPPMLEGLLHAGAHVDASVGVAIGGRAVLARDGSIAAEIAMPQFCTSWARLYTMLSDVFPEERVRRGIALTGFEQDEDGVTAWLSNGASLRADVVIGADGVRSTVRRQLFPSVELVYAGYVGWRGMVDEWSLSPAAHAALFHRFAWGLIPGEHILGYPVPGKDDDLTPPTRSSARLSSSLCSPSSEARATFRFRPPEGSDDDDQQPYQVHKDARRANGQPISRWHIQTGDPDVTAGVASGTRRWFRKRLACRTRKTALPAN